MNYSVATIYTKEKLSDSLIEQLKLIPETGMGYHYVFLYLRGPLPERQQFRMSVVVKNCELLNWPTGLGEIEEYELEKFVEITPNNSHKQLDWWV